MAVRPAVLAARFAFPGFDGGVIGRATARFAAGEWVIVPDAGHNVQEDNPAGLIAELTQFWSRHAR